MYHAHTYVEFSADEPVEKGGASLDFRRRFQKRPLNYGQRGFANTFCFDVGFSGGLTQCHGAAVMRNILLAIICNRTQITVKNLDT